MTRNSPQEERLLSCEQCPFVASRRFCDFSPEEMDFVSALKTGQLKVPAGAVIMSEGAPSAHLYTVVSGWGFRCKTLPDGRRQILNYVMPGDLVGLQGVLMGEMQHGVEALSQVNLCVFERRSLMSLYRNHPTLAYDLTWMAAREEQLLDENLLAIGQRTALERTAYLIAYLHQRGKQTGLVEGKRLPRPLTQQRVADTLGLSLVHTNKTLRKLVERGLIRWLERGCEVIDEDGLLDLAEWEGLPDEPRPFL